MGRETAVSAPSPQRPPSRTFFRSGRLTLAAEHTGTRPSMSANANARRPQANGPPGTLSWSMRNAATQLAALRAMHGLQPPTAVSAHPSPNHQTRRDGRFPACPGKPSLLFSETVKESGRLGAAMKQNNLAPLSPACRLPGDRHGRIGPRGSRCPTRRLHPEGERPFPLLLETRPAILNEGDGRFWNWNRKTDVVYLRAVHAWQSVETCPR